MKQETLGRLDKWFGTRADVPYMPFGLAAPKLPFMCKSPCQYIVKVFIMAIFMQSLHSYKRPMLLFC